MIVIRCRSRRAVVRVAAWSSAALVLSAPCAWGAPLFQLADNAQLIARGTVERVRAYKNDTLTVFTIGPDEVLKGVATTGAPIQLVQEKIFASERPILEQGARTLVFAVPLPPYSSYREALPDDTYWRWVERKDTAREVAALGAPEIVAAVRRYVMLAADPPGRAHLLAQLLTNENPRLRGDALVALESHSELTSALDAAALAPLKTWLGDERVPVTERAQVLVRLGRIKAPGVAALAQPLASVPGPLQAAAVDALVSVGHAPSEAQLLALSRREDPALRLATLRGLARIASRPALDRMAEIVRADPSEEVRLAAIRALGAAGDPRAVPVLTAALREGDKAADKGKVVAAADALGRIATPEAIHTLADTLRDGSFDAQTSAAFALKLTGKDEAVVILREQELSHPDPQVRKVIKIALGEAPDEHE